MEVGVFVVVIGSQWLCYKDTNNLIIIGTAIFMNSHEDSVVAATIFVGATVYLKLSGSGWMNSEKGQLCSRMPPGSHAVRGRQQDYIGK